MELTGLTTENYLELLASDAPAPGGGAAAALSGAQGVALTLMVVNLTVGREKYREHFLLCKEAKNKGEVLMGDLMRGMDEDKDAFQALSAAYKLPKATEEEKAQRDSCIACATIKATEVPLKAMGQGTQGLKLTAELVGKSNKTAVSDLGVAALNLLACVKSAWLNVLINLPGIPESAMADRFRCQGEALYTEAEELSNSIYRQVAENLKK